MFSGQGIPDYCCSESAISSSTESYWSNNQNQYAVKPQFFPKLGVTANGYHQNNFMWCQNLRNGQNMQYQQQNVSFPVNNFKKGYSTQFGQAQHAPLTPEPVTRPVFNLPRPRHEMRPLWHINVVQSKNGTSKAIVKRKRKRTVFTTEQIEALEEIYKKKQYLTREERQVIVDKLQLSDKPVKTWFQNRRLKSKREAESIEEEQKEKRGGPDMARLEYVESQINEKTDEFGYVTLDDGLMRNLFDVMDDVLTNNVANASVEDVAVTHACPIYEPISPASVADSNDDDNILRWEPPSEPNASLQILSDLQAMFAFKNNECVFGTG